MLRWIQAINVEIDSGNKYMLRWIQAINVEMDSGNKC